MEVFVYRVKHHASVLKLAVLIFVNDCGFDSYKNKVLFLSDFDVLSTTLQGSFLRICTLHKLKMYF